MFGVLFETL